jgi:hypothetical protein
MPQYVPIETAKTMRGLRLVVVVGTRRALAIAVKNDRIESRFAQLASRLRSRIGTSCVA